MHNILMTSPPAPLEIPNVMQRNADTNEIYIGKMLGGPHGARSPKAKPCGGEYQTHGFGIGELPPLPSTYALPKDSLVVRGVREPHLTARRHTEEQEVAEAKGCRVRPDLSLW